MRSKSISRYLAELLGTFVLAFASCGSAVLAGDEIGFLGVSLAFGLSLLAMIYTIGPIARGPPRGYDQSVAAFAAKGYGERSALMPLAPISGSL